MEKFIKRHYKRKEEELKEAEELGRFEQEQRELLAKKRREQDAADMKAKKHQLQQKSKKKKKRKKRASRTKIWMPTSKPCTSKDLAITLDNVVVRSANIRAQKMIMRSSMKEYNKEEIKEWNSKYEPIRKDNMKKQLTYDEIKNCLFKPLVSLTEQEDIGAVIKKMGKNFINKYPEVYRAYKYHKALKAYKEGKPKKALKKMNKAFNIESIIKTFHPNYEEFCK